MKASRSNNLTGALRHRNFALIWTGQFVSLVGQGIFTVALPLEVLRTKGTGLDLGVVMAARTLPAVLLLLAGGALVDRWSRRLVMLISDAVCGVAAGIVAVLIATGHQGLWLLAILSAVFGVASAFFKPASSAIMPEVLPADQLLSASSLNSLSQSFCKYLIGPVTGGVLVATVGTAWAFGLNAASFLFSAVLLLFVTRTGKPKPVAPGGSLAAEIREGLQYCRAQAWLWWSMIGVGVATVACYAPIVLLVPLLVEVKFGGGGLSLGLVFGASGVGGAIAAAAASKWPPGRPLRATWLAWSGVGLAAIATALAP